MKKIVFNSLSKAFEKQKLENEQLQSEQQKVLDWTLNGKELLVKRDYEESNELSPY